MKTSKSTWTVYIVRCADNTLYTGITTDVTRRMREHNGSNRLGAKYSKARRPVALIREEAVATRSEALIREAQIKRLTKAQKEQLLNKI